MATNLLPISSDGGFTTAGNITTESYASPAPSISGFSSVSADNVSLINGNINGGIATVVDDGINSIALALGAQMDVFGFPFSQITRGQLTISGVTTPSEVNGTWYYQSVNTNTYQIYTDSTYSTLVDATGWSAYNGGGTVAITKQNPAANIVIDSNGYLTTFDNTGILTLPDNTKIGPIEGTDTFGFYNSNANTVFLIELGSTNAWSFDGATGNLTTPGSITTSGPAGNITGANVISAITYQSSVVAISALPAATTAGLRAFVNDANLVAAGNFGAAVGSSGSNVVPVYSDGTVWRIG